MQKAAETRAKIIQQAAGLFNQQGYAGSSMSDIMRVTGLQKGGIYNHFNSKEELALAAFDFAIQLSSQQFLEAIRGKRHAIEKLQAMLQVYRQFVDNPPIPGGCPLLNTAVESDDAHPALRDRAQQAMTSWRRLIIRIIAKGIAKGEIHANADPEAAATILIATIEGALMMSKLYGNEVHLERAIEHLHHYLVRELRA
ncbi:MAG: TetR/AcrR family transcriptional regulator [Stenomitos rutilans HA7619-LM2]|jgi:AcrR family transcriptional regulator|nr:TetR/AcrR family transcriptional regulator [Stenomitos rutilans HA7619-LM2]